MGVLGGVGDTGVGQTSGRLNYNEFSERLGGVIKVLVIQDEDRVPIHPFTFFLESADSATGKRLNTFGEGPALIG